MNPSTAESEARIVTPRMVTSTNIFGTAAYCTFRSRTRSLCQRVAGLPYNWPRAENPTAPHGRKETTQIPRGDRRVANTARWCVHRNDRLLRSAYGAQYHPD